MTTIDDRRQFLTAVAAPKPGTIATAAADQGRGNVIRLAVAQALAGANSTVIYATGAILGNTLAPDKALATLPVSILVVGMAASTLPAGAIARRYGRRAAFLSRPPANGRWKGLFSWDEDCGGHRCRENRS
jgi:hypothetical protein